MPTALCLYSGGLDSRLVIKIMKNCGLRVVAFHAIHAFVGHDSPAAVRARVERECRELGADDVRFAHTTATLVGLLRKNRFGFGKNLNPCIDCRIANLLAAARFMEETGADFLATGEVLGQRPKSQKLFGMNAVAGALPPHLRGRLVRPLSAKLLPPTIPEQEGILDREKLYDISGRGRGRQMELAAQFGIGDYPSPAGGCLLTDAGFSGRMRELLARQAEISEDDIALRKVGRHQYTASGALLVSARDSDEGDALEALARPDDVTFITVPKNGAMVLLRGPATPADEELAISAAVHYSKYRGAAEAQVERRHQGEIQRLTVTARPYQLAGE